MHPTLEQKKHRLFLVLSGIFITNSLLAEMIGVKIFSFEQSLGLHPANLNILGFTMDFNLTAGVLIWPVVFITTDLINEYFGKPGVKRISYLTAGLIAYAFLIIFIAMRLHPADFWHYTKSPDGTSVDMEFAFSKIFGQGQRIIIGSLTAFIIGQLTDVYIFQKLKKVTGNKYLWLRSTGSTLISQLVDSFVVLFIAFYGQFETKYLIAMCFTNYIYKFIVAIVLTPVIYVGHSTIDKYLGKEHAEKISAEATESSKGFF
ncbi:MAG TPA: queuosine precursor transporter [Cyclobacteriaceae bacterium]|nr:queuosine precursor transporter [Cyclobacteriaceae bacterium]HMV09356.1 queuosine precursor transporter [Cyclobacteriaceae bacterium]HMV91187.1 queuosine precursor transporter [Cyclobacteriaceae bacterium]HMX00995.1 queuosine precursor transporter [Cyclobacteriaceae bacterium]HMX51135.1 queuosine precursor transporter [Cyclobacteriaceae bacterium]